MAKQQWEEDAKDRFLQFLRATANETWVVLDHDVVVDTATNRNFDYSLGFEDRRVALELFRLVKDKNELARDRVWSEVVHALERELTERGANGYLLTTPNYFNMPKVKRAAFAKELADRVQRVIADNPGRDEVDFDGFKLKRIEGLERIACSSFGEGGAINPAGIALVSLEENLPNKNEQLAVDGHERIVLVTNWAHIVDQDDVTEAASAIDFARFPNIDKIFFEFAPGNIQLVFDRSVFLAFKSNLPAPHAELEPLYLQSLQFHLARKEPQAYDLVRQISEERNTLLWLPASSRIEVVRYGTEFAKAGDWDSALWVAKRLANDPDPSFDGANCQYHEQIARGDTVNFIVTVRGHLCWLLQLLVVANRPELYEWIVDVLEEYALGPNLYIRQQATVPLIQLARRRFTDLLEPSLGRRVRALTLRMVNENSDYPSILDGVANVLANFPDLNPDEAERALATFLRNPSREAPRLLSSLLIRYAVFRERDERFGPFDSANFRALLMHHVVYGLPAIRSSILWQINRFLVQTPAEAKNLLGYVAAFASGAYDRNGFFHFYEIAVDHISNYPDVLAPALKNALSLEREHVKSKENETIWGFDRGPWPALEKLLDSGLQDEFLDCVAIVLDYAAKIFDFPAQALSERLAKIRSERADELRRQVEPWLRNRGTTGA